MTLLEILRQELPKRGGWPEGVRTISTLASGLVFFDGQFAPRGFTLPKASDGWDSYRHPFDYTNAVTREQYGASDWNGKGLPPIGVEVEFTIGTYDKDTDFSGVIPSEGDIVQVVAHKTTSDGNDVAVVYWDDKGAGRSACFVPGCLRPVRTEAERAIDEMVLLSGVSIGAAKILYAAGYRK